MTKLWLDDISALFKIEPIFPDTSKSLLEPGNFNSIARLVIYIGVIHSALTRKTKGIIVSIVALSIMFIAYEVMTSSETKKSARDHEQSLVPNGVPSNFFDSGCGGASVGSLHETMVGSSLGNAYSSRGNGKEFYINNAYQNQSKFECGGELPSGHFAGTNVAERMAMSRSGMGFVKSDLENAMLDGESRALSIDKFESHLTNQEGGGYDNISVMSKPMEFLKHQKQGAMFRQYYTVPTSACDRGRDAYHEFLAAGGRPNHFKSEHLQRFPLDSQQNRFEAASHPGF